FKNVVTFDLIYKNYRFDERFRLLLFQIIEHIEVELKSVISGDFALATSATGFYNSENFENKEYHEAWLKNFEKLIFQSAKRRELYTEHYITKYEKIFPVWVAAEISDFGSLSKFFSNIKRPLRNSISKSNYGIGSFYLANWIYLLSLVRNICAHNGRIYDRIFPIQAKLTREEQEKNLINNRAFIVILICQKLCLDKEYFSLFKKNLKYLIDLYDDFISIDRIGFPIDWKEYLR
ncbi:Abi family protein, partial [Enterococcus hirae]|nr:Abi family protein [Enterococcus hirae]